MIPYTELLDVLARIATVGESGEPMTKDADLELQKVAAHGAAIAEALGAHNLANRLTAQAIECHSCAGHIVLPSGTDDEATLPAAPSTP